MILLEIIELFYEQINDIISLIVISHPIQMKSIFNNRIIVRNFFKYAECNILNAMLLKAH